MSKNKFEIKENGAKWDVYKDGVYYCSHPKYFCCREYLEKHYKCGSDPKQNN